MISCEHGKLARQCEICELKAENAELVRNNADLVRKNSETVRNLALSMTETHELRAKLEKAEAILGSWLKSYDDCGPDNGPSMLEHECAEMARKYLVTP